jgi:dTMP kinase
MSSGKLIAIEGTDGVGKTTQFNRIRMYLGGGPTPGLFEPKDVAFSKDLGGSKLGEELRRIMYEVVPTKDMAHGVVDLLFLAGHVQNWKTRIEPWLKEGKIVVSDRWWLSQFAYGPYRGWHPKVARLYDEMKGAWPDLTIFLYGDPYEMLKRANARADSATHQSQKAWNDADKQSNVLAEYFKLYGGRPGWCPINVGGKGIDAVWEEVRAAIDVCICRR